MTYCLLVQYLPLYMLHAKFKRITTLKSLKDNVKMISHAKYILCTIRITIASDSDSRFAMKTIYHYTITDAGRLICSFISVHESRLIKAVI